MNALKVRKFRPSTKIALDRYLLSRLKWAASRVKWVAAAFGITNLALLFGALVYVFFFLPERAVDEANRRLSLNIGVLTAKLSELVVNEVKNVTKAATEGSGALEKKFAESTKTADDAVAKLNKDFEKSSADLLKVNQAVLKQTGEITKQTAEMTKISNDAATLDETIKANSSLVKNLSEAEAKRVLALVQQIKDSAQGKELMALTETVNDLKAELEKGQKQSAILAAKTDVRIENQFQKSLSLQIELAGSMTTTTPGLNDRRGRELLAAASVAREASEKRETEAKERLKQLQGP